MDPVTYLEAGGFTEAAAYLRARQPHVEIDRYYLPFLKENLDRADRLFVCNPKCRIWSDEREAWWRENAAGYTTVQTEAGIFEFSDAWRCSSHCDATKGIVYEILEDAVDGA